MLVRLDARSACARQPLVLSGGMLALLFRTFEFCFYAVLLRFVSWTAHDDLMTPSSLFLEFQR